MTKPLAQPTNRELQTILKLWDDYYLALYHELNDPKKPPELADRICRHFRPADLPNAR